MIRCRVCRRSHPLVAHAVGDRVVVVATKPRADGLQAGTPGEVVAIVAGPGRHEVHVGRKGGRVATFAPCDLAYAPGPRARQPPADYESLSREEFLARMRSRVARIRLLTPPLER